MAKTVWQPGHRASRAGCFAESTTARPARRRHHDRHSRIAQNMRQSGAVELVPRRQGLVHSRARSDYSGSSLASGNGRPEAGLHTLAANSTDAAPRTRGTGRRYTPRLDLRPSAGRVPSGPGDPGFGIGGLRGRVRWLEHLTAERSEIYVSPCASTRYLERSLPARKHWTLKAGRAMWSYTMAPR
jgi:hypothetical protein